MPTGGNNSTEITIRMMLEMKDLQKQQKVFGAELEKMKKKIKELTDAQKGQIKSIENVTKAVKTSSDEFVKAEKRKQDEFKKTTKEVDGQKKKIESLGKFAQSRTGRFLTAFAAGAGIGGISKGLTAHNVGSFAGRMVSRGVHALAGFAMSGISQAYQQYVQFGQAQGQLVGLGSPSQMRAGARGAGRAKGARLGYSVIDTANQAAGIGRATGNIGAVYQAQQFARATGMDVGEVGGYMGMVRQAGHGFGGTVRPGGSSWVNKGSNVDTSGSKVLEKVVAAGIYSGIEKARLPEFMQGVAGITGAAGGKAAGRVDVTGIAAFQALLGSSGNAGFQGARGAAVGQQLMGATVAPGGGEAGQSMMLQALGFGKPGGQTSYYDALKSQQQGMQKPENVAAMFKEVYSQLGVAGGGGGGKNQQEANIALNEMTGLSLDQIEKLGDIFNSGKSMEEQMTAVKEQLKKSEPIENQALRTMQQGFGGTAIRIAGVTDAMVGIGAKFAPVFEKMQDLQIRALKFIADSLPKMLDYIRNLYFKISNWLDLKMPELFGNTKEYEDFMQKKRKELADVDPGFGGSLVQRMQALQQQQQAINRILEEYKKKNAASGSTEIGGIIGASRHMFGRGGVQVPMWRQEQQDMIDKKNRLADEEAVIRRMYTANQNITEAEAVKMAPRIGEDLRRARGEISLTPGRANYNTEYETLRKASNENIDAKGVKIADESIEKLGRRIRQREAGKSGARITGGH